MLPLPHKKPKLLTSWFVRQRCSWPKENLYDREIYCNKLAKIGFINIKMDSIRNDVYPGMYKYSMQRYSGMKRENIVVELTEDDISNCNGVAFWEKSMGVSNYVIFTADKPPLIQNQATTIKLFKLTEEKKRGRFFPHYYKDT